MQYTRFYNSRPRGPLFSNSEDTDEGLGIITINGQNDRSGRRKAIVSVIITRSGDIVISWFDTSMRHDCRVQPLIEDAKLHLSKAYRHQI